MIQKSTTFTTIFHVKKCHFHYHYVKKVILVVWLQRLSVTSMVFVKFNFKFAKPTKSYEIHKTRVSQYTGCIKKTAHAITLLLMAQMEKKNIYIYIYIQGGPDITCQKKSSNR
jgi:hypothetical protein